jgi:hypothetical protein
MGELSKILFGMMDGVNMRYYNEQIKVIRTKYRQYNKFIEAATVCREIHCRGINNTLTDVEYT